MTENITALLAEQKKNVTAFLAEQKKIVTALLAEQKKNVEHSKLVMATQKNVQY